MIFRTEYADKLNRITLDFPDGRETEYREHYFQQSYKTTRLAYLVLAAIYAFFAYLDSVVAREFFHQFFIVRMVVTAVLLFVFLLTFSKYFKKYWQSVIFISYLIGALGILIMLIKMPEVVVYSSGLILVFLAGSVLIKLRFLAVSVAGTLSVLIYVAAALLAHVDQEIVLSNTFFFMSANLIGMVAAYRTEVSSRQNFNLYSQIARKNDQIEQANKNLEYKVEKRTKLLNTRNKELKEEVERRARVEKELISAKERAEESDRLKSAFLANMSHEIRTPMNGILGFANILKEAEDEEELNEFIDTIIQSGEHLLNLINDIIDLSKIESGVLKIEKTRFDLNRLTKEIYDMFSVDKNIVTRQIHFSYENGLPDEDCLIYTDRVRLKQIIINLVNNACKYTDAGSIRFSYQIENDVMRFIVVDTGIGIKEELQTKIFDRFMQVSTHRTSGRDSTGLGLAIAKTYLNLMGGDIFVKSEFGVGSEFSFTLPNIFSFETH